MAALAGTQGFALWLLHERWPQERVAVALFTALCFFIGAHGLVLHFARTGQHARRLNALAAGTGAVFAAIALWVAWQLPGPDAAFAGDENRIVSWCIAAAIALYALGPFIQIYQATRHTALSLPRSVPPQLEQLLRARLRRRRTRPRSGSCSRCGSRCSA